MKLTILTLVLICGISLPIVLSGIVYLRGDAREQAWHKHGTTWEITADGQITDRGLEIPVKQIFNRQNQKIEVEIKDTFIIPLNHSGFSKFWDAERGEVKNAKKGHRIIVTRDDSKPAPSIWTSFTITMEDYVDFQPATPPKVAY